MFHVKHSTVGLIICLALGGCSPPPPPTSNLAKPDAGLMIPPPAAPKLEASATVGDLLKQHAQLKALYGQETTKFKSLQRYVRALHGDKS